MPTDVPRYPDMQGTADEDEPTHRCGADLPAMHSAEKFHKHASQQLHTAYLQAYWLYQESSLYQEVHARVPLDMSTFRCVV